MRTRVDFGTHVIPAMIDGGARVFGYRFDGYWQDVGTIQSYWEANMALLDDHPELDLYDKDWVIHTRSEERAPARIGPTAQVHRSLISHGCIDRRHRRQLGPVARRPGRGRRGRPRLDRDVRLVIRAGAVVDRSIIDKEVVVGPGAMVGDGPTTAPRTGGADPPEHRHHRRRQARDHPARRPHRPQRPDRRRRPIDRLHRRVSGLASRSIPPAAHVGRRPAAAAARTTDRPGPSRVAAEAAGARRARD